MARFDTHLLDSNDRFPNLELSLSTGGKLNFPDELGGDYSVFLVYRGYW